LFACLLVLFLFLFFFFVCLLLICFILQISPLAHGNDAALLAPEDATAIVRVSTLSFTLSRNSRSSLNSYNSNSSKSSSISEKPCSQTSQPAIDPVPANSTNHLDSHSNSSSSSGGSALASPSLTRNSFDELVALAVEGIEDQLGDTVVLALASANASNGGEPQAKRRKE
jgi:hypothetical protein